MKLSVITVNLNDKEGLAKTIESVLSQTFTDYEFIVIDGKSTDGSVELIRQYNDKISYWVSEPDKGIYNAMNKGIMQAKGEYCYFLNAGDRLFSTTVFENIFAGNPSDSFICGNFYQEVAGQLTLDNSYKDRYWNFELYNLFEGFICHQAIFISRSMFDKYGLYDEGLRIMADWKLFYAAIAIHHEPVLYRDVDIVIYNMEGLSSRIGGKVIYEEKLRVLNEYLPSPAVKKLERLYYLEQNCYITDIIKTHGWLFFSFRAFCKLGRIFGFLKP